MKFGLFVLLLIGPGIAASAPFPATSTSVLTDPAKGLFFHGFGFRLRGLDPTWTAVPSAAESIFETVRFEPKNAGGEASVSIRTDRMPEASSLEVYAKKWMREYPNYGFEVLGTRALNLGGGRALLVDMVQTAKNRQLRQVVLQNGRKVAVLTCLDKKNRFDETLETCNRLIKGFEWTFPGKSAETGAQSPAK